MQLSIEARDDPDFSFSLSALSVLANDQSPTWDIFSTFPDPTKRFVSNQLVLRLCSSICELVMEADAHGRKRYSTGVKEEADMPCSEDRLPLRTQHGDPVSSATDNALILSQILLNFMANSKIASNLSNNSLCLRQLLRSMKFGFAAINVNVMKILLRVGRAATSQHVIEGCLDVLMWQLGHNDEALVMSTCLESISLYVETEDAQAARERRVDARNLCTMMRQHHLLRTLDTHGLFHPSNLVRERTLELLVCLGKHREDAIRLDVAQQANLCKTLCVLSVQDEEWKSRAMAARALLGLSLRKDGKMCRQMVEHVVGYEENMARAMLGGEVSSDVAACMSAAS
ncbi:hypothetical protein GUITHDRAFT_140958 [Guillardia theta CCMP2712]|uniref:Uncharacterized protein n=1 Tax=Guillardia theta (strain CCMP2712) TaxID=905079 RepID=L1J2R4_GUITC|nr:hypothetical protein GUITHDRAFT_140958 [Guillardia theta CCMP2712]EKX42808.1 hypothetical protein GUITHDRAFT_140958 [Guillardia theta CCMP2712]|eukprot:XP_005829788.1 hypothetical protein GUITHDRAFT_140958 [Guillardia theta CCMP2712]